MLDSRSSCGHKCDYRGVVKNDLPGPESVEWNLSDPLLLFLLQRDDCEVMNAIINVECISLIPQQNCVVL